MIAGLELPTGGRIFLGPEEVTAKRASERDIAFVFQLFALYPHMNVRANIAFPLRCQSMPRAEIRRRVEEAARILQITPILDRRFPASPAATASASRSAARSCASRWPSSWTSRSARSTPSSAGSCVASCGPCTTASARPPST